MKEKLTIDTIKTKEEKWPTPFSVRIYKSDVPKLKKLAKSKDMTFHAFLSEALHVIASS